MCGVSPLCIWNLASLQEDQTVSFQYVYTTSVMGGVSEFDIACSTDGIRVGVLHHSYSHAWTQCFEKRTDIARQF